MLVRRSIPPSFQLVIIGCGKEEKGELQDKESFGFLHIACDITFSIMLICFSIVLFISLTQEFHSLAHCTAGGCASVATSFIFTPSERIKQQMQVGSRYHNCWYTFLSSWVYLCQ